MTHPRDKLTELKQIHELASSSPGLTWPFNHQGHSITYSRVLGFRNYSKFYSRGVESVRNLSDYLATCDSHKIGVYLAGHGYRVIPDKDGLYSILENMNDKSSDREAKKRYIKRFSIVAAYATASAVTLDVTTLDTIEATGAGAGIAAAANVLSNIRANRKIKKIHQAVSEIGARQKVQLGSRFHSVLDPQ